MIMKNFLTNTDESTRRAFVERMAQACLGLNFVPMIGNADTGAILPGGGKAKSVIYVVLAGGMSQVDTLDIKEANKDAMLNSEPIKTSADGIRISKHLPRLAEQMHHCAIINSMTSHQGNHSAATYLMKTGYERRANVVHPELGAWVNKLSEKSAGDIPSFIKTARSPTLGGGFFGSRYAALPVTKPDQGLPDVQRQRGVSEDVFDKRVAFMSEVNAEFEKKIQTVDTASYNYMYEQAVKMMDSKDLEVFDIGKESKATKEAYGNNPFGKSCLLARRLVDKGVRFVELLHAGWDHHYGIYDRIGPLAAPMDQSVATLLADLSARGLLDSTLVVFNSEFGRGARLSTSGGRSHHPLAYSSFLAGGGIQGGQKYGKTDEIGHYVDENGVEISDFNATIAYAMGLPLDHVEMSPAGRPFKIADRGGNPVTALF